jgi:hypothetical protein
MPSQVHARSLTRAVRSGTHDAPDVVRIPWSGSRLAHPVTLASIGLFLALVPPLASTPVQHSRWQVSWYLTSGDYRLIVISGAVVLIGLMVGVTGGRDRGPVHFDVDVRALLRATNILTGLFVAGYAAWAWSASRHGFSIGLALATLRGDAGANYQSRADLATVPGLSTLTEVGPVLVAALVLLWRCGVRRYAVLTLVLALSCVRVVLNSERLSIIEVALPIMLVIVMTRHPRTGATARSRPWLVAGYLAAPVLILALFAVTERSRTWNSHYSRTYPGHLIQFSVDRIWGYYATAANNGAVYRHFRAPTLHFPDLTLQALTNAPILNELIKVFGGSADATQPWKDTLAFYANPEFNNPSTFLPIIGEIGAPLAVCLFASWGLVMGALYQHARAGSVGALVAVAGLSLGLLELARYPYYSSGRFVPAVVAAVIVWQIACPSPENGSRKKS